MTDSATQRAGEPLANLTVDGQAVEGTGAAMTGAQILALAGLDPDDVELYAEGHRGRRIAPEEAISVQEGSRFVTRPRDG